MSACRLIVAVVLSLLASTAHSAEFRVATFSADVTIPLGHRCMGILPTKATQIDDPLEAHGFVLLGSDRPIVLVALDWCELRNGAYDRWRDMLADAAGTTRERVLVSCLHQHDAPVVDTDAQALLDDVGLEKELCDPAFQEACLQRVADELRRSLGGARRVTHLGLGQAKVEQVASNRRVELVNRRVTFDRGSASGGVAMHRDAPEGTIDPFLKTLSFWDGETPLLAVHAYAVHPMSYYGKGGVSADFVGLARRHRQADDPQIAQIYLSGCSGNVTAGKYNDGSPAMRGVLAERLHDAMRRAWNDVKRVPLEQVTFRKTDIELPFHEGDEFRREALEKTLRSEAAPIADRILAAMSLASRDRLERDPTIDLPCVDFGSAQLVLLPGESFVGYQLLAQKTRPDSFVFCAGYGECWPGYIPTQSAFDDGFNHGWRWSGKDSPDRMEAAIQRVLDR
ncbi:MAG: hypothetical protein WBC44_20640 [Planctomycetaceae bacterium]